MGEWWHWLLVVAGAIVSAVAGVVFAGFGDAAFEATDRRIRLTDRILKRPILYRTGCFLVFIGLAVALCAAAAGSNGHPEDQDVARAMAMVATAMILPGVLLLARWWRTT